jgi:hypothetical protein
MHNRATNFDADAAVRFAYDRLAPHVQDIKNPSDRSWMHPGLNDSHYSSPALEAVEKLTDQQMPRHLRAYVCSVLSDVTRGRRPLQPGRGKPLSFLSDLMISATASHLTDTFGLKLTRGEATRYNERAESACSILQKALELHGINRGERTIEDAVKRARRRTIEELRRGYVVYPNKPVRT